MVSVCDVLDCKFTLVLGGVQLIYRVTFGLDVNILTAPPFHEVYCLTRIWHPPIMFCSVASRLCPWAGVRHD